MLGTWTTVFGVILTTTIGLEFMTIAFPMLREVSMEERFACGVNMLTMQPSIAESGPGQLQQPRDCGQIHHEKVLHRRTDFCTTENDLSGLESKPQPFYRNGVTRMKTYAHKYNR